MTPVRCIQTLAIAVCLAPLAAQPYQFVELARIPHPTGLTGAIRSASGDLNGDGAIDVIIASYSTSPSQLWINGGHGAFAVPSSVVNSIRASAVALGDIDGDGDLDIVLADYYKTSLLLLANDGRGGFKQVASIPKTGSSHLELADLDGDKDLDLVSIVGSGGNRLFLNDGKGSFTDHSTNLPDRSSKTLDRHCVLVDIDGDTDLDIVLAVASSNTPAAKVFVNDGKAKFVKSNLVPQGFAVAVRVLARDFDGDGDQDLYFGTEHPVLGSCQTDLLWLNNSKGTFADATATHLPGNLCSGATAAGDVDEDGDQDIISAGILYLNDGKGRFTASKRMPADAHGISVELADFDRDGDLDYMLGRWGRPSTVYFNRQRELYAASRPLIWRAYRLDYCGQPGYATQTQTFVSAIQGSTLPRPITVPGIRGELWLAGPFIMLPVRVIQPPGGRSSLRYAIPNDPTLRGVGFHVQAVADQLGIGVTFTNLWSDLIQ